MIKKSDWEAAYRDLIVEGRKRVGEPPTEDELVAYSRNELSEAEATRVRELLVYYPELASALEAPFPFPYEGKPGDADFLSEEELERHWASLQARIQANAPVTAKAIPAISASWPTQQLIRRLRYWQLSAAAAAVLAVTFGSLFLLAQWTVQRERSQPRVNLEHRLLLPDGQRGSATAQPPIPLPSETDYFLLIPALINHPQYPDYQLEIFDLREATPRQIWSRNGLRRRSDDTFEILVPRAFLKPGKYRLDLYGLEADGKKHQPPLARYTIRLSPE